MCLTVPGRIVSVDEADGRRARVDFGVAVRSASLIYAPEAKVGDYIIVQAGFATRVLSPAEAEEALAYHRELASSAADAASPSTS